MAPAPATDRAYHLEVNEDLDFEVVDRVEDRLLKKGRNYSRRRAKRAFERNTYELKDYKPVPTINAKSKEILMGDCKVIDGQAYLNTKVGDRLHMQAKRSELSKFLRQPVRPQEEKKQPSAVRMSNKRLQEFILK